MSTLVKKEIVIYAAGMPFNGETIYKASLGGSEAAAYYQAREFARRGHKVVVFTTIDPQQSGECEGVVYSSLGTPSKEAPLGDKFEHYVRFTPHDALIIQRHPQSFHKHYACKVGILQMHDLALYRYAGGMQENRPFMDAVTCVSEWHKKQVIDVYGFRPEFVHVVRNGVDLRLYEKDAESNVIPEIFLKEEHGNTFFLLYQSRPERGLEHLVRPGGIMSKLAEKKLDVRLLVCGYDNTVPQMRAYYDRLDNFAKALPNVTLLGALSRPELVRYQRHCDLLCYPTEFEEVSCITAMEAMAAGMPILASECAALPETCEGAGALLVPMLDGKADEDGFVKAIENLVNDESLYMEHGLPFLGEKQLEAAKVRTWESAADSLEAIIDAALVQGSRDARIRHCIEHSDIEMLDALGVGIADTPIERKALSEFVSLYQFRDAPVKYAEHYAKHQGAYYDEFEERVIGEDVTRTTRFRGVYNYLSVAIANGAKRVLDYGCAHGHYLVPLAKMFPAVQFVGVDISARAVSAAVKWVQRENLPNVEMIVIGAIDASSKTLDVDFLRRICPLVKSTDDGVAARKLFDVVFAGEVLEHVSGIAQLLNHFRKLLNPFGVILGTTPIGRWEWSGTAAFRNAREHLHHLDRADINELCGNNRVDISCAPAGPDKAGRFLGSYVWLTQPKEDFATINYDRKWQTLRPRQTVSACMIVKDAESTIRKAIASFVDWVDEIVIAIDPKSTDRTEEILNRVAYDYKWKPFKIVPGVEALKDGFDEARNFTVENATGDWILWVDADEEIQKPWNLWKYLRENEMDGYGFPQVHYSSDPVGVLTVDYPCRLFRRNGKIKFYGLIHEHPEEEPGKAIRYSAIRHDVSFLHNGYVDEETRRARFMRNLPLVYKDREINPNRSINRFLMLRDIAQQLIFEQEQTQGYVMAGQPERAEEGIKIWEEMLENDPMRVVVDALKYYSHCVAVTGKGYSAKISMQASTGAAPEQSVDINAEARFYSRAHHKRLVDKLLEEATKHYESKYL